MNEMIQVFACTYMTFVNKHAQTISYVNLIFYLYTGYEGSGDGMQNKMHKLCDWVVPLLGFITLYKVHV